MGDDIHILVRNCTEIEVVTELVGNFLGRPLERRTDVNFKMYETKAIGFIISVMEAGLENDAGIEFEKYPITVRISKLFFPYPVEHFEEWFHLFPLILAQIIYGALKCECLVMKNLFDIVGAFPASEAGEQSVAAV
jgi:hypothetical protein